MFARTLAIWWALTIGARCLALDVPMDYVIGLGNLPANQTIDVRGNATLTVNFPSDSSAAIAGINLWDTSKLIVRSGRVQGEIRILGDNRIDFRGGRFGQRLTGDGDATIKVRDGQFAGQWAFTDGEQRIVMTGGRGIGLSGSSISLDFHSNYPLYSADAARTILAGFPAHPPTISTSTASTSDGVHWRMLSTAFHPADSNRDGAVDIHDLNSVRNTFGRNSVDLLSSYLGETLPYDGRVDIQDLNRVRNAFGTGAGLGSPLNAIVREGSVVPEPSARVLMAIAMGMALAAAVVAKDVLRRDVDGPNVV
jgi:hypothetical protein